MTKNKESSCQFTGLELSLTRLLITRNVIDSCLVIMEKCDDSITYSTLIRYLTLEISSFIETQRKFMGTLSSKQKEYVLCLTPFISEISKNNVAITEIRNGWIGHTPNQEQLDEGLSNITEKIPFTTFPSDVTLMSKCVIQYVDFLNNILKSEFESAKNKLNQCYDESTEDVIVHLNNIDNVVQDKISEVKENLRDL